MTDQQDTTTDFDMMIIRADMEAPIFVHSRSAEPDLEALQQIVGGYIETVTLFEPTDEIKGLCAYFDEEGLLKQKPHNHRASMFFRAAPETSRRGIRDVVGDVVFLQFRYEFKEGVVHESLDAKTAKAMEELLDAAEG